MLIDHIWANANPVHREHLRRANEARAAAHYAAWRAVGRALAAPFRALAAAIRRARLADATYRELQSLDDRQLRDIGLARSEIRSIAEGVAERPGDEHPIIVGLTRAEPLAAGTARDAELPGPDRPGTPRRPTPRPGTRRPAPAPAKPARSAA